jgi:hypothetical protein
MSTVISGSETRQLTLSLQPGLTERFRNLREACAQGIYQRGLKRVAADLDMAPGNLSAALAEDTQRNFSVDALEAYIAKYSDYTPIYYLIERFLGDQGASQAQALQGLIEQLQTAVGALAQAGITLPAAPKTRR